MVKGKATETRPETLLELEKVILPVMKKLMLWGG